MATRTHGSLAVYYEHPDWHRPLFRELERRGLPYAALHADGHGFDPSERTAPYPVVVNRMSPSVHTRGRADLTFYTAQYLAHLDRLGVRVINGSRAWRTEISKAYQLTLLEELGLPYPPARVIHRASQAPAAATGLRFPIVVKPNIGGSGAGIRRFDTREALVRAVDAGEIALGMDETALVQECIPAADGRIVRVEVLDGRFLYAIRIYTSGATFNLCPADVCQSVDGGELVRAACPADAPRNDLRVEAYEPPAEITSAVERIMGAAGIELGGVEYMIDARDGRLYFYDVNAMSNFVADGRSVLGYDPFERLGDWLETELLRAAARPQEVA
jgi:glutathione synthase/RimK-type ligase-like ATP-grasp enzyme